MVSKQSFENSQAIGGDREVKLERIEDRSIIMRNQLEGIDPNSNAFNMLNRMYPGDSSTHPKGGRPAWFRFGNRMELIRAYFHDHGISFFVAIDGGKLTQSNNNTERGAYSMVLWAPYLKPGENFNDAIDDWHEREVVPFLVRTGCAANRSGREVTDCGKMGKEALIMAIFFMAMNFFGPHDPCIYILDSNNTAFNARAIGDEPTPIMRRRVRGQGVASGKGANERLRVSIMELNRRQNEDDKDAKWHEA